MLSMSGCSQTQKFTQSVIIWDAVLHQTAKQLTKSLNRPVYFIRFTLFCAQSQSLFLVTCWCEAFYEVRLPASTVSIIMMLPIHVMFLVAFNSFTIILKIHDRLAL